MNSNQAHRFHFFLFFLFVGANVGNSGFAQGPIAAPINKGNIRIGLNLVADNLVAPSVLTHANGRLFVADQAGEILVFGGGNSPTPYLNLSSSLVPLGGIIAPFQQPFSDYDERGLLGLTFHPDFISAGSTGFGKFYTYTSETLNGAADFSVSLPAGVAFNHQSVIREWTVDPTANNVQGTVSREIMRIDQPQFNHNGGALEFGPDKNLYVALGDGGGARDRGNGHEPNGNGQSTSNVYGSILRIDPLGNNSANGKYGVPNGNPFTGANEVQELFAIGFRNPYRMSFDINGQLIAADVGQNNVEEVDLVIAGGNYGWRYKEGSFYYDPNNNVVSASPINGITPNNFTSIDPVLEYDHDEGISIIGGFVYRGMEIPELVGKYVFGDFSRQFSTPNGRLFYGDLATGEIHEFLLDSNLDLGLFVKGFGQDENGELYLLGGTNLGPFRSSNGQGFGGIWRLSASAVPEPTAGFLLTLGIAGTTFTRRRR